ELVGLVGFRVAMDGTTAPRDGMGGLGSDAQSVVHWGPSCPDPALRLWGQQAVNRIRSEFGVSAGGASAASKGGGASEHVVIGGLIRRLRISDPAVRFQSLATTVLRSSLNMAAVAWVSKDPREQVVVGGVVENLDPQGFRALPSPEARETTIVSHDVA